MIKNILQSAESIKNDHSCIYDTNYGYNCIFTTNGAVEGWDVYDNVYLYGCWNKVLFGTSSATTCYIGRTESIYPVSAEEFPIFRMMIKITAPINPYKSPPTEGKLQWKTSTDDSWDADKSTTLILSSTDSWFLCEVDLSGHQYWSNNITSLRITPFEKGYEGIYFAIRYIRLASPTNFTCLNTQCSYYSNYSHPCVGNATFSTVTAGVGKANYTTVSGISDSLIVNIDGYGEERINLGTNDFLPGAEMAKLINSYLNRIDVGAYAYATVEHTEDNKLKITSGSLPTYTDIVSTDIDAELVVYVYAYTMASTFKDLLTSIGWVCLNEVNYLYILYGDILPFIKAIYAKFLTTNTSLYTVSGNLSSILTNQGYFTDILSIKMSRSFNITSICGCINSSGYINVTYLKETNVSVVAGIASTSYYFSVLDVFNNELLIDNYRISTIPASVSSDTRSLRLTSGLNQIINYIIITNDVTNPPAISVYLPYGFSYQTYTVDQVSSSWLASNFGASEGLSSYGETIEIIGGTAAECLGFYTDGVPTYTNTDNNTPPTGFDFAAARRLRYFEIIKLINNDFKSLGYLHKPNQPSVDAGRQSYFESLAANTISISSSADYYKKLDGAGKIIIDFTHPISDCGRLNNIKIGGSVSTGLVGEVLLFRPYKDGTLVCVGAYTLPSENSKYIYSKTVTTNYLSFNVFVSKGDLVGFKNIDLLCIHSCKTGLPNATLCIVPSTTNTDVPFFPGELFSQGVIGPSYYAYSDRLQDSLKLSIDVGKRINVDKFQLYGQEFGDYFEYNIAACLDVEWKCNLFGGAHTHIVTDSNGYAWTIVHQNMCYGLDSLNNCSVTADSGLEGTSYDYTAGLATYGDHTYFYVNGDSEWLNATSRSDSRAEFGYNTYARIPSDYENDPVALYLTIPQNKSVDLYKAVVYFKEAPNYRKMGISYYLGPDNIEEDFADVVGYKYVENITSVLLDGVAYYPESEDSSEDWTISKFVTTNPLPDSRLSYVNGAPVNSDIYMIAGTLYWNVFEYNFEPVNAYGFMLYSDWHKSTKIIEIELYSRFKVTPTLIDNVTVQVSNYGDVWNTLSFKNDPINPNLISSSVPSSPRYFKLSIEPQDTFELYEMSLALDESGKGAVDCLGTVIPTTAKNGKLSNTSCIEVENIYDVPLHLYVDVPKNVVSTNNLLSWLKLTSEETTTYGEVGPGAIVKKNYDYQLVTYNNQIAINCPSYYLKNLIDGKKSYSYELDTSWKYMGLLSANKDVEYLNDPEHILINFSFDKVSSRYWKVWIGEVFTNELKAYKLLNDGVVVEPLNAYIQVGVGEDSTYKVPLHLDSDGLICDTSLLDYTFLTNTYLDTWVPDFDSGTYFLVSEARGFYPTSMISGGVGTLSAELPYSANSFEMVVDFTFLPHSYFTQYSLRVDLQDSDGLVLLYIILISDVTNITVTAKSEDPDAVYALSGYYDDSYGSVTVSRSQAEAILGKFRLIIKKTGRILNYIKLTNTDESTVYMNIVPSYTYFSSRVSKISFAIGNTTQYNLPAVLPISRKIYSNVRTIVIDCINNYDSDRIGLRAIDFYSQFGQLITLTPGTNCTCTQSSTYSGYFSASNVFNTSKSKIGGAYSNSWLSAYGVGNAGRLICVLDNLTTFSEVVMTNYHNAGTDVNFGAKDVKITVVPTVYENIDPMSEIPGGILVYDGSIKKHISVDVADSELLTISGTGSLVSDYNDPLNLLVGVTSIEITAQPIITQYDTLLLEFPIVTPLTDIQIVTEGAAVDQAAVLISDMLDVNYEVWARNSTKFRVTAETDAAFVASGYVRLGYPYNGRSVQYPYLIMNRDVIDSYDTLWFCDIGQLPLWVAYDFGKGNECCVDTLRVLCFYEDVYAQELDGAFGDLPPFPTILHVYGSNDVSIDWESKPKDLLATVSGCVNNQFLVIELSTPKAYRYYCLYAPNLDYSSDRYMIGFQKLSMYTHLDAAKREYSYTALNNTYGQPDGGTIGPTDLYYTSYGIITANTTDPFFVVDLKELQYVSGVKMRISYEFYFINYGRLEYSLDSTNGYNGTWIQVSDFKNMVSNYTAKGVLLYYTISFASSIYATWLRVRMLGYSGASRAGVYEFMPILGQMSSALVVTNGTYYKYFAIDLGDVYSLDFVRNYGESENILSLFDTDIAISEEQVDDISSVSWANYTINSKIEARWLRILMICGDGHTYALQYLGVYPDISKAYKKYGGYNCDWASVGVGLTSYNPSMNVAPQASLYYGDFSIIDNVKTIIIDIYNSHSSAKWLWITAVELYDSSGAMIELSYNVAGIDNNYTPRDSWHYSTSSVANAFNTSNTNLGYWAASSWASAEYGITNIRISCVLNEAVTLSKIAIQNGHSSGEWPEYGAKTVAVWVSSNEIVSTVFGDFPTNALLVFSGDLPKHVALDVEDRYFINLSDFSGAIDNYFGDYVPNKCLQGDSTLVGYGNSWGFKNSAHSLYPTLELGLDDVYSVRTFKLIFSPEDGASDIFNISSYKIYGKLDENLTYTQLFYITNNDAFFREHVLDDAVLLKYIKLEIISYEVNGDYYYYDSELNIPILVTSGFLREFEVWTDDGAATLNSEEHPIICINLKEAQSIASHELVLLKETPLETTNWDNSEEFFSYSDEVVDSPNMVSFIPSSGETVLYSNSETYVDYTAWVAKLAIDDAVYLAAGSYILYWESYNNASFENINILFGGIDNVVCTAPISAAGWGSQTNYFSLVTGGYYTLNIQRGETGSLDPWGARNISIVKTMSNTKWLAVKRDTASNHAWSNTVTDHGVDYINRIRVFSDTTYLPTEFPWFWSSTISTISREHANTKEGRYALKIDYPTASGVDRVNFIEGDHFGWDEDWSIKDTLSFWWYISDLDNLYIDEGGFGFGCFTGGDEVKFTDKYGDGVDIESVPAYYLWDFKYMGLKTGWNEVKLQFDKNTCTAPLQATSGSFLEKELNFRENYFTSFGLVYKGYGRPFYMLFDGLKIERNRYNDVVNDAPGLCLTWQEYAEIPLSGITLYTGTIEFWVKLYTTTGGVDIFGNAKSRVLFTLTNNYNELICLTLKSAGWLEIGFGGARCNFNVVYLDPSEYDLEEFSFNIDESFHVAVVWSSSGTNMDNSDTMRLYINNTLLVSSKVVWEVSDTKSTLLRFGGGSTILANNNDEWGSAIFNQVKVYDYCKTNFLLNTHEPEEIDTANGNAPIQISKDGVIFYNYKSEELPLKYEGVSPGEKVKVYTRIDKTNKVRSSDSGTLEIDWEVIV